MAKIGLNYGEKLQIADKTYRVMPIAGIEPVTFALRVRCSTN